MGISPLSLAIKLSLQYIFGLCPHMCYVVSNIVSKGNTYAQQCYCFHLSNKEVDILIVRLMCIHTAMLPMHEEIIVL